MLVANMLLAFIGFFGWLWVWAGSHYQTDATPRIQIGVALIGLMWLLLIIADTVQHLQPTGGTILARIVILFGLYFLKPLLETKENGSD